MTPDSHGPTTPMPEYNELYGWEQRACLKGFKFHLDQGAAAHPEKREVVWDRAVYLGYFSVLQRWKYVMVGSAIPLWVVAGVLHAASWLAIAIVICLLPPLSATTMYFVRVAQSRKRHPYWHHYKLDVTRSDWEWPLTD